MPTLTQCTPSQQTRQTPRSLSPSSRAFRSRLSPGAIVAASSAHPGSSRSRKSFMPVEIYHRIINQLQAINYAGRISPYLMNESLLDKRLPELLAYTRAHCPESWIAINTNGDALSEALA